MENFLSRSIRQANSVQSLIRPRLHTTYENISPSPFVNEVEERMPRNVSSEAKIFKPKVEEKEIRAVSTELSQKTPVMSELKVEEEGVQELPSEVKHTQSKMEKMQIQAEASTHSERELSKEAASIEGDVEKEEIERLPSFTIKGEKKSSIKPSTDLEVLESEVQKEKIVEPQPSPRFIHERQKNQPNSTTPSESTLIPPRPEKKFVEEKDSSMKEEKALLQTVIVSKKVREEPEVMAHPSGEVKKRLEVKGAPTTRQESSAPPLPKEEKKDIVNITIGSIDVHPAMPPERAPVKRIKRSVPTPNYTLEEYMQVRDQGGEGE